jgi:hypothetical protein
MQEQNFPAYLQDEVFRHLQISYLNLVGTDEKKLWDDLPKDLHQEIVNFMYSFLGFFYKKVW